MPILVQAGIPFLLLGCQGLSFEVLGLLAWWEGKKQPGKVPPALIPSRVFCLSETPHLHSLCIQCRCQYTDLLLLQLPMLLRKDTYKFKVRNWPLKAPLCGLREETRLMGTQDQRSMFMKGQVWCVMGFGSLPQTFQRSTPFPWSWRWLILIPPGSVSVIQLWLIPFPRGWGSQQQESLSTELQWRKPKANLSESVC